MGVPTFFKWLSTRYPRVLRDANEPESKLTDDGDFIPPDPSVVLEKNPNGEVDNLYLDMNGIIHPCCHPEGCEQPESNQDRFYAIFEYIDRLILLVRPRRLLVMAIDGVAPRAKMNQQRTRRFKSAAEAAQSEELWQELVAEAEASNSAVPEKKPHWDSNQITPGTPFFEELSRALRWYVLQRQLWHPGWKKLRVLLSDANSPGEGEHKIMKFIRDQRKIPGYDANTRHCLCGADADLIMLGLATHEPHFCILREQVLDKREQAAALCPLCKQKGHSASDCPHAAAGNAPKWTIEMQRKGWQPLSILDLEVLREYLAEEFAFREHLRQHGVLVPVPEWNRRDCSLTPTEEELANAAAARERLRLEGTVFVPDIERCIDDFIILCFFVGNDFLPHLPSLSIHKGSIDQMLTLYQEVRPQFADYLCDAGVLNLEVARTLVGHLGNVEADVFRAEARRMDGLRRKDEQQQQQLDANYAAAQALERQVAADDATTTVVVFDEPPTSGDESSTSSLRERARTEQEKNSFNATLDERKKKLNECHDVEDRVGLGQGDPSEWRRRYYAVKIDGSLENGPIDDLGRVAGEVARKFAEGMQWVALYYFQGVPDWGWYFPFHYAPLASDVAKYGLNSPFEFTLGEPFTPFQQLMAVLPAASAHCLPKPLARLMTDPNSPIADFYPTKFTEDPDGKKFRWQWVCKLPFIDQDRLKAAVNDVLRDHADEFSASDLARNSVGLDQLFLPIGVAAHNFYDPNPQAKPCLPVPAYISAEEEGPILVEEVPLRPEIDGMGGMMKKVKKCLSPQNFPVFGTPFDSGMNDPRFVKIEATASTVVGYSTDSDGEKQQAHVCQLLPGAKLSSPRLGPGDALGVMRRFNAGPAIRMIMASLGKLGVISKERADAFFNQQRGGNASNEVGFHRMQQEQQGPRVNRYAQEMFRGGRGRPPHHHV